MVQPGLLAYLPISTSRLRLRPFVLDDADALYELHRDPIVTRYAGGTMTRSQSEASLHRNIDKVAGTGFGALAVEELDTSIVIGWSGVQQMLDGSGYELIYALRADKWGQGFATEASVALLKASFDLSSPVVDVIHGLVYRDNRRSIRVLEKLGMSLIRRQFHESTQRVVLVYALKRTTFYRDRG